MCAKPASFSSPPPPPLSLAGPQLDIQQRANSFPLNISRGGGRKMCIIFNQEKLPYQFRIFWRFIFIFFSVWGSLCGKSLKFIFQGQILLFWGENLVLGGFFSLGKFVYGKS